MMQSNKQPQKNKAQSITTILALVIAVLFYVIAVFGIHASLISFDFSIQFTGITLVDTLLLLLGVFALSIALSGYLAPLVLLFVGIAHGNSFNGNLFLFLKALPLMIAVYAGINIGSKIKADFDQKGKLEHGLKKAAVVLGVAIVLGLSIEFILPNLPIARLVLPN